MRSITIVYYHVRDENTPQALYSFEDGVSLQASYRGHQVLPA
jgi:hypothetical protein